VSLRRISHQIRRRRKNELNSTVVAVNAIIVAMTTSLVLFHTEAIQQLPYQAEPERSESGILLVFSVL
jgi:hypothetical protein